MRRSGPFFRSGAVGELPYAPEGFIDLGAERQGVETAVQRVEAVALVGREDTGGEQALIGRLRAIIALGDSGPVSDLRRELAERLEEVPIEAQDAVEGVELGQGGVGRVPIVADEATHDRPVLLLGVRLIVLAPGAAAGEVDVFAVAPRDEDVVQKLSAVIGVKLAQRHRKALADEVDASANALVALAPDRLALGPTGGDIDGD